MAKKILVTGGAGFVGTRLVPRLLERGYSVRVLDNLMYEQVVLLNQFINPNFEFVKGSVADEKIVERALEGVDMIIHLACIVGGPACQAKPDLAREVNVTGIEVVNKLRGDIPIIFPSTGSVYGKVEDTCTEETVTNPLTFYGKTKLDGEWIIKNSGNYVIFRVATAFGMSQRMRTDLMINDFVHSALNLGELVVFQKTARRTFIHVDDFASALIHTIKHFDEMKNEIYNLGNETMNCTKEDIAEMIKRYKDYFLFYAEFGSDPDQRDYEVSYQKLRDKGFFTKISLKDGIKELIKGYKMLHLKNPYSNQIIDLGDGFDLVEEREEVKEDVVEKKIPSVSETGKIHEVEKCRICGNPKLIEILDLGRQPLSGRFPDADEADPMSSPLKLMKCDDSQGDYCGLLQLKHTVDLGEMYGETYGYRTGLNQMMAEHIGNLSKTAESLVELNVGDVVLDIGSSDGTLLKAYQTSGLKKIGIDPAARKFSEYYPEDVGLVVDFFGVEKYKSVAGDKKAKVVTSVAMFYDLEVPMDFVKNIKEVLHPEGIWVLEQSYMPRMLEVNSFYMICQEHLEYYSFKQIEWLVDRAGLKIFDVEFNEINGGSFRLYVCHKDNPRKINIEKIQEVKKYEKELGLNTSKPYDEFKIRIEKIKKALYNFLKSEKEGGKKIHVYAASTKGNVILHHFNIGKDLIDVASDRNEDKWGKVTPGMRIPIVSEEDSRNANPDYYLVLPWSFKKVFIEREKEFLRKGGKMIFPLPNLEMVSMDASTGFLQHAYLAEV